MYVCIMYGPRFISEYGSTGYGCQPCCSRSAEQGKLFFLRVSVRPGEFGLARQVRPFRPASARSSSTPGWNTLYIIDIDIYFSMVTDTVAPKSDFARQKSEPSGRLAPPNKFDIFVLTFAFPD